MNDVAILELELINFRIHKHFKCNSTNKNIGIIGPNGSGKTSVLEAISLLSPGRGLLSAKSNELVYNPSFAGESMPDDTSLTNHPLGEPAKDSIVSALLNNGVKIVIHSKYLGEDKYEKILKINDKICTSQSALLQWCDVLWFTSQMQYDFLLSSTNRRKFIDRMTYHLFPDHAVHIKELEKLNRERMKVMNSHGINNKWLDILEKQIAVCNYSIIQNRLQVIENINSIGKSDYYPQFALLEVVCLGLEKLLSSYNKDEAQAYFIETLFNNRASDLASNRTLIGAHRSDFTVYNVNRKNHLENNSSGEQKVLLISLMAIFAKIIGNYREKPPIILFDELVSFLDKKNIDNVIEAFSAMTAQIWMTSAITSAHLEEYSMQVISLG